MKIDEMTIGEFKELSKIFNRSDNTKANDIASHYIGEYCVFRTYSAGVFCGFLEAREGMECVIKEARRIWSWNGAFTLSELSQKGVSDAKMSIAEPEKLVTQVIEVIPTSKEVKALLSGMKSHDN